MRNSLIIAGFFIIGILVGSGGLLPDEFPVKDSLKYSLYALMLIIGLSFGSDPRLKEIFRTFKPTLLIIPLTTIIGTFLGILIYNLFFSVFSEVDSYAIGAGFGWYSLSGILITEYSGEMMGTIALLANVIREIITLLFAPAIVSVFGKTAAISAGGATSMDTTLPIIIKTSGKEYMLASVFHGIILTILVPFIISFLYKVF